MCMGMDMPPYGIPVTDDIHKKYPPQIKKAWKTFHSWWIKNNNDDPVSKSTMPPPAVSEALKQITEAPIPGFEGKTGKDSCYIIGVNSILVD